jgi:DNA-binding HxlR family transcriptional regulator
VANRQTARQRRAEDGRPQKKRLSDIPGPLAQAGTAQLDRLVHERIRLGILSGLAVGESRSFSELKHLLKTSDGNLSVHARKLEDAGYIACSKRFDGRLPRTEYQLTGKGRRALERYLDHMEALIRAMRRK